MRGTRLPVGLSVTLAASLLPAPLRGDPATPPPEPEAVVFLLEAGRLSEAERELRTILARDEDPVALDLLGVVLGRLDRPDEAEAALRRAVALDPDFAPARKHLARIYLARGRDADAAVELRALPHASLERDLGLWLAGFERDSGNGDAAEQVLRGVAGRHGSVRALLELARLQTGRGDHEASLATLRRALEIAPNSEAVLRAHAEVSMAAGAPLAAVWTLEPLTRMHPMAGQYPYLLGVIRLKLGDAAGAAESLERALELDPDDTRTLIALGLAHNNQRRFDEAADYLARSLSLEPGNAEALAALAQSAEGLGDLERAERHARRTLDRDADHHLAHLVLGMIRMKRGDHTAARDALLRSLDSKPDSVKAHYQLSLAYARLGDRESSERHLELYRQALALLEATLIELNTRTGTGGGGMRP